MTAHFERLNHESDSFTKAANFDNCTNMKPTDVIKALDALAQDSRLAIYRILVQQSDGLTAGALATRLNITPPTMSHHLEQLSNSGLTESRREGRYIIYTATPTLMSQLLLFLAKNCCLDDLAESFF